MVQLLRQLTSSGVRGIFLRERWVVHGVETPSPKSFLLGHRDGVSGSLVQEGFLGEEVGVFFWRPAQLHSSSKTNQQAWVDTCDLSSHLAGLCRALCRCPLACRSPPSWTAGTCCCLLGTRGSWLAVYHFSLGFPAPLQGPGGRFGFLSQGCHPLAV